jgi:ABC-type sulfate/molybdate transport systems ATPase subunit
MTGPRAQWPTRATRRAQAGEALARVGLSPLDTDAVPGELSVGQAQRVALAQAGGGPTRRRDR